MLASGLIKDETMTVALAEWLELVDRSTAMYLDTFIVQGGAAVKFVIADDASKARLVTAFLDQAAKHGLVFVNLSCAEIKLHMMQDVFFAVSHQIKWETDAQCFVERMFERQKYRWPTPGEPIALKEIADFNHVDATLLRREFNGWLTSELMNDTSMAQDFRIALMQLYLNRFVPALFTAQLAVPPKAQRSASASRVRSRVSMSPSAWTG
jgi:hypothetical protein